MNAERKKTAEAPKHARGKLKIGDDWNTITIIALSQSNPLKAVAEMVENCIDAQARTVTITRGREHGQHFLTIHDDGAGVPRDADGRPDFRYVATHICDSIKRRLKADGAVGLQGEFGIGLLSFWTVGDELTMTSTGADQRAYKMVMRKGDPGYAVTPKRALFADGGTEVRITPLLEGIRALSGEKFSGTSPPSCAIVSGSRGCVSPSSMGWRASNTQSSRASTRADSCISGRSSAPRWAMCTPNSI